MNKPKTNVIIENDTPTSTWDRDTPPETKTKQGDSKMHFRLANYSHVN